ncbi:polyprenyl synthetase family protein [Selenomonas massiliensis]|uniref:polyprenyl synthetase family protein n=1 Tax=Selenomonas massiliensis TaxID=2058293 RepID=UPI000D10050B|nr:polyprenyl synthetase family protein [Selenomonas massiliensis]
MKNDIFDVIQADLEAFEPALAASVVSETPLITDVGEHLVSSGGKRLRPALFLLAARGGAAFDRARAMPIAVALELIHTASLVHDDVIDEADTRRGAETTNAKWGNQVAILSGDYLFARAFKLVAEEGYDSSVYVKLAQLVCTLSEGEILQDHTVYQVPASEHAYYERIRKKTADFLEICCELGGAIGGMSAEDTQGMALYGHAIGMAFQITDDLLDYRQTSEHIGKPAGRDLAQGFVTLPVIRALEVLDAERRTELTSLITNPKMTDDEVARALEIVRMTDGLDYAQEQADAYLARAEAALPESLDERIRETCLMAADFIGRREF